MKKIYNCDFLNTSLHFLSNNLRFCCAPAHDGPNIDSRYPGAKNIFTALMKIRQQAVNEMKEHIAPKKCEGCIYLKEYDLDSPLLCVDNIERQDSEPLISNIIINHFQQCDCYCIYCPIQMTTKMIVTEPQKSDYYDLYPIIKQFYKEKLIDKENLKVEFQGGSIGVLKEFADLVNIFVENGVKEIKFFTNGIKFMPEIVEASEKTKVVIITSIDAGTRETFKRIKILDKFDIVVENLRQYRAKCKNIEMYTKFVLMEKINDSKEELNNFLKLSQLVDADKVQLDFDYNKFMNSKGVRNYVPEHFYELFEYFKEQGNLLNLNPFIWEYTQQVLDKGYFE